MNEKEYKEAVISLLSKAVARSNAEKTAQRLDDNLYLNPDDYDK